VQSNQPGEIAGDAKCSLRHGKNDRAMHTKIVVQQPPGLMRVSKAKWLESLIWRGGLKTAQDDNWRAMKRAVGAV
jgi:hypothetical protein